MTKKAELTGMRFGKLTALRPTGKRHKDNSILWLFQCDCGNIAERSGAKVARLFRDGQYLSCNKKKCRKEPAHRDLTGMKFGKLTALRMTEKQDSGGNVKWLFQCECGAIVERVG